ncbi:MAG: hypothetical protein F6K39_35065 [Okeania sp. SIO3B3]|nr:hypothetical protein [Okeania sp. SIO3B3]
MKSKHLLIAGLGLISFVGISLSSVQKAVAQSRIVEDNRGRLYLAVPRGSGRPDAVCTSDNQYCFNVSYSPSECYPEGCIFPLSFIDRRTDFRRPSYSGSRYSSNADWCRGTVSSGLVARMCTMKYPEEVNPNTRRKAEEFQRGLRKIGETMNRLQQNYNNNYSPRPTN